MQKPDIGLMYDERLPSGMFDELKESLAHEQLHLLVEARPPIGPQACAEWFVPSIVAAYIGKSYFASFLKEAGKDHYQLLKSKLSGVASNVMSTPRIEPVILGTPGKVSKNNPYSSAFSVFAEANDGKRFKLLVPKQDPGLDYGKLIEIFLEFLSDYHSGVKTLENVGFDPAMTAPGNLIFVHVNSESMHIEWLDERAYR